jgi:DNA invertase Pin-like site-specific DNA recombinase
MSKTRSRRAYSYIRFSHAKQAEGGSLERQLALTRAYCERRGLALDDSLDLQDLGLSAFRSDNVKDGALAGFLQACRTGRVPSNSVLVIESLDRLSRDQIRPALQLFLQLQEHGITIVTHQPEREHRPDATDALGLIEPLIIFARAHEESAMKSHRRKDGWRQARERARAGGGPMLKTCPAWLEVTPDGFRVKEQAAAVVRRIFAMARDGLGVYRITERLTREGVPPIGSKGRWVRPYVYRILTNPAAMGSQQPQRQEGKKMVPDGPPIPKYFPAVVTEQEWNEAQAAIQRRTLGRWSGRKGPEETNLFTGILRCAITGENLQIIHALGRKRPGEERKRYVYLTPSLDTGTRSGRRIDYAVFEPAVLSLLSELRPADVAAPGKHENGRKAEIAHLSGRLLDIDSRLGRTRQRARTAGDFDAFLDLIQELQAERREVRERLDQLEQEEDGGGPADLGEAQSLIGMLAKAADGPAELRGDLRRRLKGRLAQLVTEVRVLIVRRGKTCLCACQFWFRGGGRHRNYLIMHRPGTRFTEGRWWVRSLADVAAPGDLDLRKREHAEELEAALAGLEVEAFGEDAA